MATSVYAMPDQKTERILVDEVIPLFGIPEALLSDQGTNFLSHLMKDVCSLLGITPQLTIHNVMALLNDSTGH